MLKPRKLHPTAIVALGFFGVVMLSTMVLMLPISRTASHQPPDFLVALFTATSAVCVTGLTVVDTGTYWSSFGQAALLVMFQVGGFGMMVSATLLGLWAGRSMQLRTRLLLQNETHAPSLGDVKAVFRVVWITALSIECITTIILCARFALGYDKTWGEALWLGFFHSISAFNNAGFSLFSNSLENYASDGWILLPIMMSVIISGLGFPVLYELWQRLREKKIMPRMTMHAHITIHGTCILLAVGTLGILLFEWNNIGTLANMSFGGKWWSSAFTSVVARTAGFNALDIGAFKTESLVLHYLLMFIGAGSSGTAGGIKLTTVGILLIAAWSEIRGYPDAEFLGRRISNPVLRQALTILVLASAVIVTATLIIMPMVDLPYKDVLFEVISAFGTVGVSTGITQQLPTGAKLVIIALMFIGRVGVVTLAMGMAAMSYRASYHYPKEKPIVG